MSCITPDWPAPTQVKALTTCRDGGVSEAGYTSFNLASHVDDEPLAVANNRENLVQQFKLPAQPVWLNQVHGTAVVDLGSIDMATVAEADASMTIKPNQVCAVMTADCLPILLCNEQGSIVAAVHAGWRGLLAGVVENTVTALGSSETLLAWLGPAIGPGCFEVGAEVKQAFVDKKAIMRQAFQQVDDTHHLADLYALARMTLLQCGVKKIYGGEHCTYNQFNQFYSYRREPITGRMASLIWLQP